MAIALTIGILFGAGVFMILRRGLVRVIVGFVLMSHAVNLLLVASGGLSRRVAPIGTDLDPATTADPLPQAFVLTAVVIAFAVTVFMLVLSVVGDGDDDTDISLAGRAMELPELDEDDELVAFHRANPPTNWHAYLDRADDTPDEDDADTVSAGSTREDRR